MHVDVDIATGPSAQVLLKYEESDGEKARGTEKDGDSRWYAPDHAHLRASVTSRLGGGGCRLRHRPSQPASTATTSISGSWERQGRTGSGEETKKGPSEEGNITNSRRASPWSIN